MSTVAVALPAVVTVPVSPLVKVFVGTVAPVAYAPTTSAVSTPRAPSVAAPAVTALPEALVAAETENVIRWPVPAAAVPLSWIPVPAALTVATTPPTELTAWLIAAAMLFRSVVWLPVSVIAFVL